MGNTISSVFSELGQVIGNLLGHPLDFLSGRSCDSICGPIWDLGCYIENFCVAHLLKMAMVAMLVYFVLLFFYLLYNLGICQCICHTMCRITWCFFAAYFSAIEFCCSYFCYKLRTVKRTRRRRRRRRRDIEEYVSSSGEEYELGADSYPSQQPSNIGRRRSSYRAKRKDKSEHLRQALRPQNHRAHVEFSGNSRHLQRRKTVKNVGSPLHNHIRVKRSSRFSRKTNRGRSGILDR